MGNVDAIKEEQCSSQNIVPSELKLMCKSLVNKDNA